MFFHKRNIKNILSVCILALLASASWVFAESAGRDTAYALRFADLDPAKPVVALTFDDGPNNIYTPQILDILAENDAKATFFMVGNLVKPNREMVLRVQTEGHEIGNHSFDHSNLNTLTSEEFLTQIHLTNQAIASVTGETPNFLRPPYGSYSPEILAKSPIPLANWSLDTKDWESRDVESVVKILKNVQDGDVVLLHDLYQSTVEAVKLILPALKEQGFQFVTLSELLAIRGIEVVPNEIYRNAYRDK